MKINHIKTEKSRHKSNTYMVKLKMIELANGHMTNLVDMSPLNGTWLDTTYMAQCKTFG